MNLVDLNGRQDEPDVVSVLRHSHGSEAALEDARAHYRSGEWLLLGWQGGDEILACAGAESYDADRIGIRSIAVVPYRRNRGLARALIDALGERMGAERVVAETDDDAVGFYRRCGFVVDVAPPKFGRPRYWCECALPLPRFGKSP
jgi:ribosomal protein S18 acetylase RimI-like enzyme